MNYSRQEEKKGRQRNKERRKDAGQTDELICVGGREVDPACGAGRCPGLNFAAGVAAGGDFTHPAGRSSIRLTTIRLCRRVAVNFNPAVQMAPLTGKKEEEEKKKPLLMMKRSGGRRGRK